jgi:hypothetical protein
VLIVVKKQKENYMTEKKRITNDMLTIMRDERIIVLADWLKVRSSLKNWIKLYCVLKPGIMLLYKSDTFKSGQWVGTIMLSSCQLLERPSKKHGFCFKLFHPLERSIWASKVRPGYVKRLFNDFLKSIPYFYENLAPIYFFSEKSKNLFSIKKKIHLKCHQRTSLGAKAA